MAIPRNKTSGTIQPNNTTDANFRLWAQHIHDTFALAWTQTTDTGQINLTTVTRPLAANTSMGYEIWKMTDPLAYAGYPVFVRIEYGSAATAAAPGIWFKIGTGSNGAGAITGRLFDTRDAAAGTGAFTGCGGSSAVETTPTCYGLCTPERIGIVMFANGAATTYTWAWSLERTTDTNGVPTADGVQFMCSDTSGGRLVKNAYLPFNDPHRREALNSVNYLLDSENVTLNPTTNPLVTSISVSPVQTAWRHVAPWSGMWAAIRTNHISIRSTTFLMLIDQRGAPTQYRVIPNLSPVGLINADTNAYILLRWTTDYGYGVLDYSDYSLDGTGGNTSVAGSGTPTYSAYSIVATGNVSVRGSGTPTYSDYSISPGTGVAGASGSGTPTYSEYSIVSTGIVGALGSAVLDYAGYTLVATGTMTP